MNGQWFEVIVSYVSGNWFEIFGYFGMALVLASMMMTKVMWLRILNMAGAIVSAIYGIMTDTWPTAFLNIGILLIQIVQIIRLYVKEKKEATL